LEVAPYFRLKPQSAKAILRDIKDAVGKWKKHARDLGIPSAEQEIMAAAFHD
jgi:serine/threonine-protein kinase HipA